MIREYAKQCASQAGSCPRKYVRGQWYHFKCVLCGDNGRHFGINPQQGAYRCLRCGVKGSFAKTATYRRPKDVVYNKFGVYYSHTAEPTDVAVGIYASSRGLDMSSMFLAYGRDRADGALVFLSYGVNDSVNYLQYRRTDEKFYRTLVGTVPRLNYCARTSPMLVITEGPVDAERVRMSTGLWTSPLWGDMINADYLMDILDSGVEQVLLFLDNDVPGRLASIRVYSELTSVGVGVRVVSYPPECPHKDPGEMRDEDIVKTIARSI